MSFQTAVSNIVWNKQLNTLINISDTAANDLQDSSIRNQLVTKLSQSGAYYIGVGNANQKQASESFITTSLNGKGIFVDYEAAGDNSLDSIASAVAGRILAIKDNIIAIDTAESSELFSGFAKSEGNKLPHIWRPDTG